MSLPFPEYESFDALGLAALVKTKEVTPVELVEAAIARIEQHDGDVNAVVWKRFDRARAQAKIALASPDAASGAAPFAGVPFLVKDLLAEDTGEPSTGSCRLLDTWRAEHDAELVARFKRAGAIILGRTNTPEFGIYGVTEPALRGPTKNPWDLARTPGGSSGGSGAAVAARYVPMAHGGDGGGSIRIPAAHCGLVGMKPTRARNPMGPALGESWAGLVVEHVLTRTVRDSAAMLDATAGPDRGAPYQVLPPAGPYAHEVTAGARGDVPKLRIAFTDRALFGDATDPDCVSAVRDAAQLAASLGHEVSEAVPPFDREALLSAYFTIVAAGTALSVRAAGVHARRKPRAADFEQPTWMLKRIADKITAAEYAQAIDTMHAAHRTLAPFFETYDVFLTPTAARPPVLIGELAPKPSERILMRLLRLLPFRPLLLKALDALAKNALDATPNTMLFNMTGQPAVSLPLWWNQAGLPIGTQWVAPFGDEARLFRLAAQLEVARPWIGRRPLLLTRPSR